MKLSCTLVWLPGLSIEKAAQLISEARYSAIEIPAALQANPDKMRRNDIAKLRHILNANSLELSGFCGIFPRYIRDLYAPSMLEKSYDYVRRLIDLASELDAKVLVWGALEALRNIPKIPWENVMTRTINRLTLEKALSQYIKLLKKSGAYAEERGIVLAIEPQNRFESNIINSVHDAVETAIRVGSPAVKVLCDTFHMNLEDPSLEDAVREAGEMLAHVHISDSNRLIPGMGHINFPEFFEALKEVRYDGYITLEAVIKDNVKSNLIRARRYLEKLL